MGCSLIVWASAGNCERTQARSRAVDEEEEEVCSAIGIVDILIRYRNSFTTEDTGKRSLLAVSLCPLCPLWFKLFSFASLPGCQQRVDRFAPPPTTAEMTNASCWRL